MFWFFDAAASGGSTPLGVVSVQHVNIIIPATAASSTATISSVTPGLTSIFFGDFYTSVTGANGSTSAARIELTDSTTVTAYRNTADATRTVTVQACVVHWRSSTVESVQYGTTTIGVGNTSSTPAIPVAVDPARSVVMRLGATTSSTAFTPDIMNATVELTSGSSLTVTRGGASDSLTVGFCVVQFKADVIQSLQTVTITDATANTSYNGTISAVTTSNCLTLFQGQQSAATTWADVAHYVKLQNTTTVLAARSGTGTTSRTIKATVLEFVTGIISSKQDNVGSWTTPASLDYDCAEVQEDKAILNSCGFNTNGTTPNQVFAGTRLTNTLDDVIRYQKGGATSANAMNAELCELIPSGVA